MSHLLGAPAKRTRSTAALNTLTLHCTKGITANREHRLDLANGCFAQVSALGHALGYETSSRDARRALH